MEGLELTVLANGLLAAGKAKGIDSELATNGATQLHRNIVWRERATQMSAFVGACNPRECAYLISSACASEIDEAMSRIVQNDNHKGIRIGGCERFLFCLSGGEWPRRTRRVIQPQQLGTLSEPQHEACVVTPQEDIRVVISR